MKQNLVAQLECFQIDLLPGQSEQRMVETCFRLFKGK